MPEWILNKNLSPNEKAAWDSEDDANIIKVHETERALLLAKNTDYG